MLSAGAGHARQKGAVLVSVLLFALSGTAALAQDADAAPAVIVASGEALAAMEEVSAKTLRQATARNGLARRCKR